MTPKQYKDMINEKLMTKRHPEDVAISLNHPEHRFKKYAEKMNWALMDTYEHFSRGGAKMFHLILSLQEYFEMSWLTKNVLSPEIRELVEGEMSREYGMQRKRKEPSVRKPAADAEIE